MSSSLPECNIPIFSGEIVAQDGSHALRNPLLPQQPIHTNTKQVFSNSQKATCALRAAADKEKHALLMNELSTILADHQDDLKTLAEKHAVKVDYVQKLITQSPHLKAKWSVSLQNALLHAKALEVNTDLPGGQHIKLPELRALVLADSSYQTLSKEEEDELKLEVIASREEKKNGARLTNKAVSQDVRCVLTTINDMVTSLSVRTGAAVIVFATCSHVEDRFEPNWIVTDNALNFTTETLGTVVNPPTTMASMQKECSTTINNSLKTISQNNAVTMNYCNYDKQIIQKYSVKLVGWTFDKFVSPFDIKTIDTIRTLAEALRCGSCHWIKISRHELTKHAKEMEIQEENGKTVGTSRKRRSNFGTTRPKGSSKSTLAGDPPSKKAKTTTRSKGTGKRNPVLAGSLEVKLPNATTAAMSQLPPGCINKALQSTQAG